MRDDTFTSRVTRSSKCWQPPPPGPLIFWSRRWGATASWPTRVCQLVLLKLRARLGLRRYPTELLAVADVSERELRAAESGAPSCTTAEASARPWGRQCFPIRQLAVALVMTVSSLFRVLVRSPICPLIRSLSAESRSSSSGVARPFTTHGSKSRIDLLGSPAAYNCWISWTRSTALSGKWRWPLRLRSGASTARGQRELGSDAGLHLGHYREAQGRRHQPARGVQHVSPHRAGDARCRCRRAGRAHSAAGALRVHDRNSLAGPRRHPARDGKVRCRRAARSRRDRADRRHPDGADAGEDGG
jgi:hypothetical protein